MVASVDYPCTMPNPLIAKFSATEQEHWQRNDVQSGPPRYLHLTDARPTLFSVAWSFDKFQLQVFEAWYRTIINYGSTPFNIALEVGGGIKDHECYFDASYTVNQVGQRWSVVARLLSVEKQYDGDCLAQGVLSVATLADYREISGVLNGVRLLVDMTLPDEWESIKYGVDFS